MSPSMPIMLTPELGESGEGLTPLLGNELNGIFAWAFMGIGGLALISAIVLALRNLVSPYGTSSWTPVGFLIAVSALSMFLPSLLGISAPGIKAGGPNDSSSEDTPEPSPTPESTAEPSAEPVSDPISLPEFENPMVLWTWVGVAVVLLIALIVVYHFVQKVRRDRTRRVQEANELAQAQEEAQRLAEEAAVRQKEAAAQRARIEARWATITDRHKTLTKKILDAETDWDTLFDLPALSDVSHRPTRNLHRAMQEAENAVTPMPADFDEFTPLGGILYAKKIHAFEEAWSAALTHARKVGTSKLPETELRTIQRIRKLLILAEGKGASRHEVHTAYTQIRKLVNELRVVQVPHRTLLVIESRQRLALTSSPASGTDATGQNPQPTKKPQRVFSG